MSNRIKKNLELKPLFVERMKKLLPEEKDFQNYLDILKITSVNSIRCNTLKISPEKLKENLEKKGWKISQLWKDYPEIMIVEGKFDDRNLKENKLNNNLRALNEVKSARGGRSGESEEGQKDDFLIPLSPGELGRSLEHLLGYYYIQELASMLPIIVLKPKSEEIVLDLCASPGSKTTQTASAMQNTGLLIANEPFIDRLKILASNLERCGVTNTIITRKDGRDLPYDLKNSDLKFSKILVDAPCSGEGTLRSSPKTYLMWNIKTIKNLPKIQFRLFAEAFSLLKKDGEIIYSTCTHAPEENEGVVSEILETFKDEIEILDVKKQLPKEIKAREGLTEWDWERNNSQEKNNRNFPDTNIGNSSKLKGGCSTKENFSGNSGNSRIKRYNSKVKLCARIYPHDNNTEGFFIAKFKRTK